MSRSGDAHTSNAPAPHSKPSRPVGLRILAAEPAPQPHYSFQTAPRERHDSPTPRRSTLRPRYCLARHSSASSLTSFLSARFSEHTAHDRRALCATASVRSGHQLGGSGNAGIRRIAGATATRSLGLSRILDAGGIAGSAKNRQPWRFLILGQVQRDLLERPARRGLGSGASVARRFAADSEQRGAALRAVALPARTTVGQGHLPRVGDGDLLAADAPGLRAGVLCL